MLKENTYYNDEKKSSASRLIFLIVATFFSLMLYQQASGDWEVKLLYVAFTLMSVTTITLFHYLFISRYPNELVAVRKNIMIFLDLLALTFLILLFEKYGLFLMPLYIIIVMRNGLNLGISYFYTSIALAIISWLLLLLYSPYWMEHVEIIATFAVTTLLLPLYYLKFVTQVHEKNHELNKTLITTSHEANYDALTGIANRKMYKEYMKKTLLSKEPFSLLFIDLNKFKIINDTYGHDVGDKVLQESVSRLLRAIDEDDFLARLGGDEFVIITKRKLIFMKKFIEKIEKIAIGDHMINGTNVRISLSIGISSCPSDSNDEMTLSKHADDAMYIAKKKPNTYHQFYSQIEASKSI